MPELVRVLSKEQIDALVADLAEKISSDYAGQPLVLIGVLKGAFIFLADLARHLSIPVEIDFLSASSYGSNAYSSGQVTITRKIGIDVKQKNLLLVEDIIDTGQTMAAVIDYLRALEPKSIRICAMIDKQERRSADVSIHYAAYRAEEGFLVGYGLDHNEKYRQLPDLYHLIV